MDNINKVIKELKTYVIMKKELEATIKELEEQVKNYMTESGLDQYITDDLQTVCRYTEIITNRFDTASFKKAEADLYNKYLKESKNMRFTIN